MVYPEGIIEADVRIIDGVIEAIGRGLSSDGVEEVIDASGMLVFPGVVDEHVHMREPGLTHKDNFSLGTKAAAAGGVTTVLEMPNTLPPVESRSVLEEKREYLAPKAHVDFGLYGVIHDSNLGEFNGMVEAGAVGFKIFLGPTTGNIPPPSDGTLYEVMLKSGKTGVPLVFHAENYQLVKYFTEKVRREGRGDLKAHTDSRPDVCEVDATRKLTLFAEVTGARVLVVHMSSWKAVEVIKKARESGVTNVYAETCPHYLLFTVDDYRRYGTIIKVNPPIRDEVNRRKLWEYLRNGTITHLGSDHAPHSREEKERGVWEAASGFTGVQTFFPVMLDLALKGKIELTKLPLLLSRNPAKLFNLYPRKGDILVGGDGDLVIVNPREEYVITEESLYSKYPLTPYINWRLKGRIKYTILRGEVIARDGVVEGPPKGRWIRPLREGVF